MAKASRDKGKRWIEEDRGYDSPCWIWQGAVSEGGYARTTRDGRMVPLHRWHYEQRHGPIADGLESDHLCNQPSCVNPDHIEAVTRAENVHRSARCRLTAEDVEAIRVAHAAGKRPGRVRTRMGLIPELARRYAVDEKTIKNIAAGRTWAK